MRKLWVSFCLAISAALALAPLAPAFVHAQESNDEETSSIRFVGQLIELSSTETPTTIVVRKNPEGAFTDYTVDVTPETAIAGFGMSDWITGDSLDVWGTLDESTGVVVAEKLSNRSMDPKRHKGLNGWVTAIDTAASTIDVKWSDKTTTVAVTADTKMVVPPKNPAALSDFLVGDRVRFRLVNAESELPQARIIVALRRGDEVFLKARTRKFEGTLNEIDTATKTLTVTLEKNEHLRANDVNNLVGVEGEIVTVSYDDKTEFVRKYEGKTTIDEFLPGDELNIVGRVGDDGIILARLVKNESIFSRGVGRQTSTIVSVDVATNTILATVGSGTEWTITYTDETKIHRNSKDAVETDLQAGDVIRVHGTANSQTHTVAAEKIAAKDPNFHPLKRIRELKEIVKERMKAALGLRSDDDIVKEQEPAEAAEDDEDFDDDGVKNSEDSDDDNDSVEDIADSDDDNDEIEDETDSDDDNDTVEDADEEESDDNSGDDGEHEED